MKTHTSPVKGNHANRQESYSTPSAAASLGEPTPHNNFAAIPAELKALARWVNWQFVERDGKPTKEPINPQTGNLASCSDPDTWGTYSDALARLNIDSVDGIGFQLGSPYTGVDLDGCRDSATGDIEPWAQKIIASLNSYTEVSPRRCGVHIWVKGNLPPGGRRKGHIEMYCTGRYLTVTGLHLDGTPKTVEERQTELTDLHAQIFGTDQSSGATTAGAVPAVNSLSDDEIINRARNAKNGDKFCRLWSGDSNGYDSPSEADLALCMMLSFWTGRDADRIDSLFRLSKLLRPKWDERHSADGRTYGQVTIEKAIEGTREVWHESIAPQNGGSGGTSGSRPIIIYSDRQLDAVTHEALDALRASNSPPELFVRSGQIVRVRTDEEHRPIIDIVGEPELRSRLASVTDAMTMGKSRPVNCFPHRMS
jgi:putative DNA primase/helicase